MVPILVFALHIIALLVIAYRAPPVLSLLCYIWHIPPWAIQHMLLPYMPVCGRRSNNLHVPNV